MSKSGIYQIVNKINGKFYLGSAVKIYKRFSQHKDDLRNNRHDNSYLQNAWNKYGEEAFEFIIVELVSDKNDLLNKEQSWINWSNCCDRKIGYNIRPNASSNLGMVFSKEARQNMSMAQKGRKFSEQRIENMKKLAEPIVGVKRDPEIGLKISKALKGKLFSDNHKLNLSISNKTYASRKLATNVVGLLSMGL